MISLIGLIALLIQYRYGMVVLAAIIEGPTVGVICGFLLRLGYFDFWPLYLTLIGADLVGDTLWYSVGFFATRPLIGRFGHWVSLDRTAMEKLELKFKKHQNLTLLISKMTSGFGFAILTLVTAGTIKIPLKNYAAMNILGGFVWSGIVITVGYFFGQLYTQIDAGFRLAFLIAFSLFVLTIIYGFGRFMRNRLLKSRP